jgi:site-specific recombinase XerD
MSGSGDPSEMSPNEAQKRFINKRSMDNTDRTIRGYNNRLIHFVRWCEEEDIQTVDELSGWLLDQYAMSLRQDDYAPATVKSRLSTLVQLLKYLANIEAVPSDLPEKVDVPNLEHEQETSDKMLETEDAKALLEYFRDSKARFGTAWHVTLEVFWVTGCRMGAFRGLDLGDYHPDKRYLDFQHRPPETPLKNGEDGERAVKLPPAVCDALDTYIARERFDKRDEQGREPLFTTRQGRPSFTTIRAWCYLATQPCLYMECPHGKQRPRCAYTDRAQSSKCPSSRSPHQVRTGSITWHRDQGMPIEVTAERVNATPKVIKRYYDKADRLQKMEERREAYTENLDITEE